MNNNHIIFLNSSNLEDIKDKINDGSLVTSNHADLIIVCDKNSLYFKDLVFLSKLMVDYLDSEIRIGLWGLPYCVLQFILGPPLYSHFHKKLIQENDLFEIPELNLNTIQLVECRDCIKFNACYGLGVLENNLHRWHFRLKNEARFNGLPQKLRFRDPELLRVHNHFKVPDRGSVNPTPLGGRVGMVSLMPCRITSLVATRYGIASTTWSG